MDILDYKKKWDDRFLNNDTFEISAADLREFKDDTAAFLAAASLLANTLTLTDAQALLAGGKAKPGLLYAITGNWNATGTDTTVYVDALTASAFAATGWVVDSSAVVQLVTAAVAAGTWQVFGVDAYTKTQTDALLATKQGAILTQVYQSWPFNSTILTLTSSSFNQQLRLDPQANSTLNLPTPSPSDVGKVIVLWQYGRAANLTVLVQAKYTNGVKPLDASPTPVVPVLPFNYVAELVVVLISRGTPFNDTVPAYAVVGLSSLDTSPAVTPAQLATVATTLPIAPTRGGDFTLALSDAGCLVPVNFYNPVTVTVPAHADVPFPVGTFLYVAQDGTGDVIVVAASGVVLQVSEGPRVPRRWDEVALHKRDLNTWVLKGGVN